MSIYQGNTSDDFLNGCLGLIRTAEYGKDARAGMANSVQRCYELAKIKVGATNVSQAAITEHTNRIRNAYFGEEVRDALRTGLLLCFTARAVSPSSTMTSYLTKLIDAQTGEDLKNYILMSIVRCCQEVNR